MGWGGDQQFFHISYWSLHKSTHVQNYVKFYFELSYKVDKNQNTKGDHNLAYPSSQTKKQLNES